MRDDGNGDTATIEAYYCTRCTSIRWDDGQLHYKNIGAAPVLEDNADKVTPIRKG